MFERAKEQIYPKGDSGQGGNTNTPQESVTAAQVDVDGAYMQYLTRMINIYIKNDLSHCLHFHDSTASKSVPLSPRVFTQVTPPVSHWEGLKVPNTPQEIIKISSIISGGIIISS